jgi:hypothetical protein
MTAISAIGIDRRGEFVYAARLCDASGRPAIEKLSRVERGRLAGNPILSDARAVFSVPDNDVMAKWLHLPKNEGHDVEELCRFELAASLLEPEERFTFDILSTGLSDRFIGLTYRRERLAYLDDLYGVGHSERYSAAGYRARALALGRGYITFCRPEAGDLICLTDFTDAAGSICLVYRQNVVGLAHLPFRTGDFSDDEDVKRLAIECKTVINFKLSSLCSLGITLPLSVLVICGDSVDDRIRTIFAEFFPAGVTAPRINDVYLLEGASVDGPLEGFLVAMGLTVN